MTDEYKLVTNQEVYDASQDALQKAGAVEREVKVLNDGKRTMWRYVIPNVKVKVAKDDYVNPEIMIKNSYDGSWEIGILAGAYRLVCSNGMVIGVILSSPPLRTKNNVFLGPSPESPPGYHSSFPSPKA